MSVRSPHTFVTCDHYNDGLENKTNGLENVVSKEFILNKCTDVHIGNKNVHNNNIIINQGNTNHEQIQDIQTTLEEVIRTSNNIDVVLHRKNVIRICSEVKPAVIGYLSLGAVLIISVLIIFVNNFNSKNNLSGDPRIISDNNEEYPEAEYPVDLKFVSRNSWGAAQPYEKLKNNTLPLRNVIFIHTVSGGTCNKFNACKARVLGIQEYHMSPEVDYGDIGYNFVIGSDGYIYVGVGWDKIGSHTFGKNTGSLGVAFIGDFRFDEPNENMLSSAKRLLQFGVEIKKLSEDYQIFGHCQVLSGFNLSPGINILRKIYYWSHWNDTNSDYCTGLNDKA